MLLYVPKNWNIFSLRKEKPWQIGWAWSLNIAFKWVNSCPDLLQTFWTIHQTLKWTSCGLSPGWEGRLVIWFFSGFIMKMFWNPLNFMALFKMHFYLLLNQLILEPHITLLFLWSFDLFPWDQETLNFFELTKIHIGVVEFSLVLFLPAWTLSKEVSWILKLPTSHGFLGIQWASRCPLYTFTNVMGVRYMLWTNCKCRVALLPKHQGRENCRVNTH